MTAAARKAAPRPSALEIFVARAEARALLWQAAFFTFHEAVDALVPFGRQLMLSDDEVQWLMAAAFAKVRDDL